MGDVFAYRGRLKEALSYYEQAKAIFVETEDFFSEADALKKIGETQWGNGRIR